MQLFVRIALFFCLKISLGLTQSLNTLIMKTLFNSLLASTFLLTFVTF